MNLTLFSVISVKDGLLWQIPTVAVTQGGYNKSKTLSPVSEEAVGTFLTIGVVSGHKLEGLINKQNWQREFQHNHPLVKRQGGNVEDNLGKMLMFIEKFHCQKCHMLAWSHNPHHPTTWNCFNEHERKSFFYFLPRALTSLKLESVKAVN